MCEHWSANQLCLKLTVLVYLDMKLKRHLTYVKKLLNIMGGAMGVGKTYYKKLFRNLRNLPPFLGF